VRTMLGVVSRLMRGEGGDADSKGVWEDSWWGLKVEGGRGFWAV